MAVPASVPPPPGLRWMRFFTGWSLVVISAASATVTMADATVLPALAGPLAAVSVVACGVAAALFARAVFGAPVGGADADEAAAPWLRSGPFRWALPVGAVAGLAACLGAQAAGGELWPWVLPPALVTGAAMTATGWPRLPVAGLGVTLTGIGTGAVTADWWTGATAAAATALCIGSVMAQVWMWDVATATDRARRGEAAAAVVAERLRFAAELHDIQGHSLQVIVLKSELAARLAQADPGRAATEMREVETLARDALRDTREVVHGYRAVSLGTEVANAVRVLAAAGVDCATRLAGDPAVPAGHERLFALVVREATTNIIRHSAAARAAITVDAAADGLRLTVTNDAPLPAVPATPGGTAGSTAGGTAGGGLDGLAQRVAAAGGRLDRRRGAETFEVVATLPHPARDAR